MAEMKFEGLGVALVTPFNKDFSIDYEALEGLLNHVVSGGSDYLVVLGTTGEPPTLTLEEKIVVTQFIKEKTAGNIPLVLGIGGNSTSKVIEDIIRRDLDGYSAILSVTPYYNKPNQEGLFQHYKAISEASPLPVILYNVPGRTGVNLSADTTTRLSHTSEKIIGVKEASGKIEQTEEIIKNARNGFCVISGDDGCTAALMKRGAKGVISVLGNAFPGIVKKLVTLCQENKNTEAEEFQKSLQPIIGHLFEDGNPGGVKTVLAKMGLMNNVLRLPLVPVSRSTEERLYKEVERLRHLF